MYITFYQKRIPREVQITFDDIFNNFGAIYQYEEPQQDTTPRKITVWNPEFATRTEQLQLMYRALGNIKPRVNEMLTRIHNGENMYETFFIPKASGGLRRIDAPKPELKTLLRDIKNMFENEFRFQSHNRAFAYVRQRSALDALKVHQENQSRWFLKLDVKDFFPSCTVDIILNAFSKVYPFAILRDPESMQILRAIAELATLNNTLPQGTPLSPILTNIIMVPFDHEIQKSLWNFNNQRFIYTRYADDLLISSVYDFDWRAIQTHITNMIRPFQIKTEKTRYGSSAGRNWNLGLMLNKENNITIGHKKKERLKVCLYNFFQDFTSGNRWSILDTQILIGQIAYYTQIEPAYTFGTVRKYEQKYNLSFKSCAKAILNPAQV